MHDCTLRGLYYSNTPCHVPFAGRCGALKMMLADYGQQLKENLVTFEEWGKGDVKASCVSVVFIFDKCK